MKYTEDNLISDEMSGKIVETVENLVTLNGAKDITVRKVLKELDITNRVFYNRFRNINEVLEIVYMKTVVKIRESIPETFVAESWEEFYQKGMEIVVSSLKNSYEHKMQFSSYMFENDSLSKSNFLWWKNEIKKLLDYAMEKGFIKKMDSDVMAYSIWCFIRGYNADAVSRNLPKDEAVENFMYSFGFLLEGMRRGKDDV